MTSWIRRIFTLPLFVGILIFSFSTKRSFAAPDTVALERKVAFLPALNMKQPMRADFELTNAKIIGQDETGFFLKNYKAWGNSVT